MTDQVFRAIAWLEARIEAAYADANAHPASSGNRAFYTGQAIAYESALSVLQQDGRLLGSEAVETVES